LPDIHPFPFPRETTAIGRRASPVFLRRNRRNPEPKPLAAKYHRSLPMSADFARRLRRNATIHERCLWDRLRKRQVAGCRFRRQVPLGNYIVDFVCYERRLIVEVDGAFHNQQREKDATRSAWLESQGYQVLRFWNSDVLDDIDGVLEGIWNALQARAAISSGGSAPAGVD
jgi:very-short-patch-repair endonuclease